MSERHSNDEILRGAFQALSDSSGSECSPADLDRIWRAVEGELPADERRELVERLATDPACAEAWRVAHELRRSFSTTTAQERRRPRHSASWLAVAAVLLMAASVVFFSRRDQASDTTFRDYGRPAIASLVPADAALPKDAFQLRWTPGPQDSRYQVQVSTEDLRLLATVGDLTRPEVAIDSARLADVPRGSRVLWQVQVTLPDGERAVSPTFVTRVQ